MKDEERRQEELLEEPLVEAPRLAEHCTDLHAADCTRFPGGIRVVHYPAPQAMGLAFDCRSG